MTSSKILDENPDFKNFIDELGINVITSGTGIGEYFGNHIIYIDRITGGLKISERVSFNNGFLGLYYSPIKKEKTSPNHLFDELYKHKEIPCDKVNWLTIVDCILDKDTMIAINKVLPNLKLIYVINCKVGCDSFFSILSGVESIVVQDSTIANMRIFNGANYHNISIEKTRVKELTREHIICGAKHFRLKECNIDMPMFLINTDLPNCIDFHADNKEAMCDLDVAFLSPINLEELYFNATITNVGFLSKFMNLTDIQGLSIDLSKNREMLMKLKRELENRVKYLKSLDNEKYKNKINYLIETYSHMGEEGYSSYISGRVLAYFDYIFNNNTKYFYKHIKIECDPLDLNNWINKSQSNNIKNIVKELKLVSIMPYELRQQIGTAANTVIRVPKQNEFLDILEDVRKKTKEKNWNITTNAVTIDGMTVYDMYGNPLIDDNIKHIYSNTYDVLSSFEQEIEYQKETRVEKIISQYKLTEDRVINYLFRTFQQNLKTKASNIIEDIKKMHNKATGDTCPICGKPMVYKYGGHGLFKSCQDTINCKYVMNELTGENCPKCGKPLESRVGRYGPYISCSDYQNCKYKKSYDKEGKLKSQIKRGVIDEKDLYKVLINDYMKKVLEELFKYNETITKFGPTDYAKIRERLPYLDFPFGDYQTLVYTCMAYKYITGDFPSVVKGEFANIELPEEFKTANQDGIIEVVYELPEEYTTGIKRGSYKKVVRQKYLGDNDLPF